MSVLCGGFQHIRKQTRILLVLVFLEPNPMCPELAVGARKKTAAFSLVRCWVFHKWSRERERERERW
jgi:hypothetical protein